MTYDQARAELILFCGRIEEPTEKQVARFILFNEVVKCK